VPRTGQQIYVSTLSRREHRRRRRGRSTSGLLLAALGSLAGALAFLAGLAHNLT